VQKPEKPTSDFPLFAHHNGQWAKKIKGRLHYFGPWGDPQGALERFLEHDTRASNGRQVSETPILPANPKPAKPHADFPLYAHRSGRWAKKIRGRLHYFGPWDDPEAALNLYIDQKDDLLAGREPQRKEGLTVRELVNRFLASKEARVETGELKRRSFEDYDATCGRVVEVFGRSRLVTDLRPADFERLRGEFAKTHGPTALSNDIGRVRVLFNFAYKEGLLEHPMRFGSFQKPSKAVLRRERQKKGPKMFKAREIRALLKIASPQLRAMILLGINCGLGNNDCVLLPLSALDLKRGWLDYPRPKTGVERRCRLWPETVKALRKVIQHWKEPHDKAHADKVFITKYRTPWTPKGEHQRDNPISKETVKVLSRLKTHRPGLGFYALRHTFETIAGEAGDQAAVNYIMGHVPAANDMSAVYRERMTPRRLSRVVKHVRGWLFHSKSSRSKKASSRASASAGVAGSVDS